MRITIRKTRNIALIQDLDRRLIGTDVTVPKLEDHVWWLAYVDGKVAGYAGLKICAPEGGYGYLCRAGVLKEYRGLGIQKRLIRVREQETRRRGLKHTITYTARHNYPSANNLIRSGYTIYDPVYRYGLRDALYFIKELSP